VFETVCGDPQVIDGDGGALGTEPVLVQGEILAVRRVGRVN